MGKKRTVADSLDEMVEHIRYEVLQIVDFAAQGNGWAVILHPDLARLTQNSILEAGLIHLRCVIEFLGDKPTHDKVRARDYLPGWDWKTSDEIERAGELSERLAHLGIMRCDEPEPDSADEDGTRGFKWDRWLTHNAPVVLAGFRRFLEELRVADEARYTLFLQPRPDLPRIDLVALLAPSNP